MKAALPSRLDCAISIFFFLFAFCLFTPSIFARSELLCVGLRTYASALGAEELPGADIRAVDILDGAAGLGNTQWPSGEQLQNSQATKSALRSKLQILSQELSSGDSLFYFHCGHGYEGGDPLETGLLCYDQTYSDLELAADLAGFDGGVRIVLVVEACMSGGLFKQAQELSAPWRFGKRVLTKLSEFRGLEKAQMPDNVAMLTSSAQGQSSWFVSIGEVDYSGAFSYFVLESFTQGDGDQDGNLNFLEVYDYAAPRTRDLIDSVDENQDPQKYNDSLLQSMHLFKKPSRVFSEEELHQELSSGCSVDPNHRGSRAWVLYLPLLLLLAAATTRKLASKLG